MLEPLHLAKLVHIFAVILMVGATVINGVIHGQAKSASPRDAAVMLGLVMRINRYFMAPSLIVIPVSGVWLMQVAGYDLGAKWLSLSLGLSVLLIAAFLIGYRFERTLHAVARQDAQQKKPELSARYGNTFQSAAVIGFGALVMSVVAVILMIFKPY